MSSVKKILFTSYDGIPDERQGGPNNIISGILKSIDRKKFSCGFLSYRNYFEDVSVRENSEIKTGVKKKITDYLYYNTYLYKMLTTRGFYLKRHFELRGDYFRRHSDTDKYDIIHSHDTLSGYFFSGNKALKILTIHGNGSIESDWADAAAKNKFIRDLIPLLKRREIEAFNKADIITFPGAFAKELFLSDYAGKLNTDKDIRVIHNGIDIKYIDRIKSGKETLAKYGFKKEHDAVLLNVASHVRQKNIDEILNVVDELIKSGKNPLLVNAGFGPLTDDIKAIIRKKKLGNNVFLAGKLNHDDVIKLMKSCDAVIMMSDRVIFDLVMLEASACGAPVITDLSGGNREMLSGYNGLVEIKNTDAGKAAELILSSIYSGKVTRKKNTEFGFSLANMVKGYEALYGDGKI